MRLLLLVPASLCASFVAAGPAQDGAGDDLKARDHAVLVGCNDYPRRPLQGCANDVALIRDCFVDVLGVDPARIAILADLPGEGVQEPTRANILGALARVADRAQRGRLERLRGRLHPVSAARTA